MQGSLSFSGGSDRVDSGSAAVLDNVNVLTYVAWMYPTSNALTRPVIQKGGSAGKRLRLFGGTSAGSLQWVVAMSSTNGSAQSAASTFAANVWSFVACTYDAAYNPKIFKGSLGGLVSEVTYSATPTQGTGTVSTDAATSMLFGGDGVSTNFPGRIALPRIFNRVLSLKEIADEMAKTAGDAMRPARGAVLSHVFTGRESSPRDFSGRGNTGTITGAVAAAGVPLLNPTRKLSPDWLNAYTYVPPVGGGPAVSGGFRSLLGVGR